MIFHKNELITVCHLFKGVGGICYSLRFRIPGFVKVEVCLFVIIKNNHIIHHDYSMLCAICLSVCR